MKPIAQTASLVVVLAALGMAGAYTWKTQFSHEAKIAKLVKAVLTDPESAQFKNISLNKESGVTCGEVNAKNKMGGYIGFTKFLSLPSGQVQLDPPNPSANQEGPDFLRASAVKLNFLEAFQSNCRAKAN